MQYQTPRIVDRSQDSRLAFTHRFSRGRFVRNVTRCNFAIATMRNGGPWRIIRNVEQMSPVMTNDNNVMSSPTWSRQRNFSPTSPEHERLRSLCSNNKKNVAQSRRANDYSKKSINFQLNVRAKLIRRQIHSERYRQMSLDGRMRVRIK